MFFQFGYDTIILLILFLSSLMAAFWISYLLNKSKKENQALKVKLESRKTEAEEILPDPFRYKLDPHLLKNALNAIQSHAYQSYYALDKLSNVLDYILYDADTHFLPLKEEVAFAQNLIEINRLKISPLFDLHVRKKIDEKLLELPIAPFVTINPIENAFKHADVQSEGSFISVIFEVHDQTFTLSVSNRIQPRHTENTGLRGGLGNKAYRSRLDRIYGSNYKLQTEMDGDIYKVRLEIKLHADH